MTDPQLLALLGSSALAFVVFVLIDSGCVPKRDGSGYLGREENSLGYWMLVAVVSFLAAIFGYRAIFPY